MSTHLSTSDLPARVQSLLQHGADERATGDHTTGARVIIGLVGPPGVGKSTISDQLAAELGPVAQLLPMDGFHLAQTELERLGRADRKGAPDTFDVAGFVNALQRVRADEGTVLAPAFNRVLEDPIAAAIAIEPQHRCVIVEGNYLLHRELGWQQVRGLLDETWFLDLPHQVRLERLTQRHIRHGRSPAAASVWVAQVDEPNAQVILHGRDHADVVVQIDAAEPSGAAR